MRAKWLVGVVLLASAAGFAFSTVSTFDAVNHLDRQVHGIHCSYLPGMDVADVSGTSGCYTTMMSAYSAVLGESIWGGIPVALPAMSVFAFIFWFAAWMLLRKRELESRAAGFLFAATLLPFLTSVLMGYIALVVLDAQCKLCIGIYLMSTLMFIAGALLLREARRHAKWLDGDDVGPSLLSRSALALAFCLGILFVAVPFLTYAAIAPDYTQYIGNCGALQSRQDSQNVLVPIGPQNRETEMIEVFDPLCLACGAFEQRFARMRAAGTVSRKILLFPLDNTCNWMVDESIHPGACAVSEAVLCAGDGAELVMEWAFKEQEAIVASAAGDSNGASKMVVRRFPKLKNCIGSTHVRARLNRILRWAVKNQLQVLTPQVFIDGLRLCDEDTDLGLEYALPKLISRAKATPQPDLPEEVPPLPSPRKFTPPDPIEEVQEKERDVDNREDTEMDALIEKAKKRAAERAKQADVSTEDVDPPVKSAEVPEPESNQSVDVGAQPGPSEPEESPNEGTTRKPPPNGPVPPAAESSPKEAP